MTVTTHHHQSSKLLEGLAICRYYLVSLNVVMRIDLDIKLLESFAENQASFVSKEEANQLKKTLVEARQLVNFLFSNNPENFLNPVIRG
ncbi:hypothetical protein L2E82_01740 [Cichorium intybus]|uniref:Uncharacterized protein n=1 Tax=Cichorium intybus TaxID=13427 RepID=A0ACB9H077_CICIN|nr:hypothetical protein L2E82_01740 [Cichorium intybus]